MKTTTLRLTKSVNRSHVKLAILLIPLVCFALSPQAQATCQEGCLTNNNTVFGDDALLNNTGTDNTAIGASALKSNTTGYNNTAIGSAALKYNTTGNSDTAIGVAALENNTTSISNTAIGYLALTSNTTGNSNTAIGVAALEANRTGTGNTATGDHAIFFNTTGISNTATGDTALYNNVTGNNNTAHGAQALSNNGRGNDNTAIGFKALAVSGGSSNIALGSNAGANLTSGSNNIYIGSSGGTSDEHAKIRIGTSGTQKATFVAGISGVTVPDGVGVIVGTDGKLGTVVSSKRYKDAIEPMDKASEAILALKPVSFRYKKELDPEGIPQFGLVAEEVEKVNPDLVARDADGKAYTVRYEAVNAMLLNEFLKEHRKIQELEANAARQQKQIEALTAGLQKVSAQIEASKTAPQTVLNDQ